MTTFDTVVEVRSTARTVPVKRTPGRESNVMTALFPALSLAASASENPTLASRWEKSTIETNGVDDAEDAPVPVPVPVAPVAEPASPTRPLTTVTVPSAGAVRVAAVKLFCAVVT